MKKEELVSLLIKLRIPQDSYSINSQEYPNESYCLFFKDNCWEVYYSEKGHKNNLKTFTNEEDAIVYFKTILSLR